MVNKCVSTISEGEVYNCIKETRCLVVYYSLSKLINRTPSPDQYGVEGFFVLFLVLTKIDKITPYKFCKSLKFRVFRLI